MACAGSKDFTRRGTKLAVLGAAAGAAALSATAGTSFTVIAPRALGRAAAPTAQRRAGQAAAAQEPHQAAAATLGLAAGAVAAAAAAASRRRAVGQPARTPLRSTAVEAPVATKEKSDLSATLPDCPATIWNAEDIDIEQLPKVEGTAPLIIDANDVANKIKEMGELQYFTQQREAIMEQLQKHGAIWFRNFESTKDSSGFRSFYEALQLNPCLDPIHTSGLREMVGKKDAVYEAVNKPSLAQHYVGLHNESTYVKTATYGAFVCFKPASEGGGEFTIADGASIISDMDKDVLRRLYERKVRISVSNLDLNFIDILPEGIKEGAKDYLQDLILKVVAPKFDMDLEMVYGADTSNPWRLQAIEHAQSPINRHPVTGQPVWFCNMHNHSRYLRDRRPCTVPEVGMTDVYLGDLSRINPEDVRHINEVCEKNIKSLMMQPGDIVLLDNYRVLHGRNIFKGERKHAVTWFESCGEPLKREVDAGERPDDFMNTLINKTLV